MTNWSLYAPQVDKYLSGWSSCHGQSYLSSLPAINTQKNNIKDIYIEYPNSLDLALKYLTLNTCKHAPSDNHAD